MEEYWLTHTVYKGDQPNAIAWEIVSDDTSILGDKPIPCTYEME